MERFLANLGTLIVNNGDMSTEASGGYSIHVTRVINQKRCRQKPNQRISLPLLLHTETGSLLSKRHTGWQLFDERLVGWCGFNNFETGFVTPKKPAYKGLFFYRMKIKRLSATNLC